MSHFIAEPHARQHVEQHDVDRPEHRLLPRRELAEDAAEDAEGNDEQERQQIAAVKRADAGLRMVVGTDGEEPGSREDVDADPEIEPIARPEPARDVAGEDEHAPHQHDET